MAKKNVKGSKDVTKDIASNAEMDAMPEETSDMGAVEESAKKSTTKRKSNKKKTDKTPSKDDPKRMVKIKLFKDKDKYSEDVTVVVNGTTFRIQRGVEVEVPYYVAEVIRNSEKADAATETMISELTGN